MNATPSIVLEFVKQHKLNGFSACVNLSLSVRIAMLAALPSVQMTQVWRLARVKSLPNKAKMRAGPVAMNCFCLCLLLESHLFDMARDFDAEPMRCSLPLFVIVQTSGRRMWERTGKSSVGVEQVLRFLEANGQSDSRLMVITKGSLRACA